MNWIFIAKAIAIICVVIGHFHPVESPNYWTTLRSILYSFHMPFFILISGYLYVNKKYSYIDLIKKKIERLVFPFIFVAILFFLIKYVAGIFVTLEHPVTINSLLQIIINPILSYMPLLWFVHILFIIFLVYPILRKLLKPWHIILILTIINSMIGNVKPESLILRIMYYLPFFSIGEQLRLSEWKSKYITFITLILLYLFLNNNIEKYIFNLFIGVCFSLSIIQVSIKISTKSNLISTYLINIGKYSMSIYLFHTFFESAVRIIFSQLIDIEVPFIIVAGLAIVTGLVFPYYFEKLILRKFTFTRRFLLGIN